MKFLRLLIISLLFIFAGCSSLNSQTANKSSFTPTITSKSYGQLSSGEIINQYELIAQNIRMRVINYGGIITHIEVPDREGHYADVVLGYDSLADYEHKNRFFGAIVGRYANRINKGVAEIDGNIFQLKRNKPPHQIHGGTKGFDKVVWAAKTRTTPYSALLELTYVSADGEEGYPGDLAVTVLYEVTNSGQLKVTYKGNSNKTTIFNPTQHSYFNLSGKHSLVTAHQLTLNADKYVELDPESVPTGNILPVKNTPFDFVTTKFIGDGISDVHPQISIGRGYDHFFVSKSRRGKLTKFAELYEPSSGRKLVVETTEVGGQLYSANYLNETVIGKNNKPYKAQQGICIETGQLPNAPAEPMFSTVLVKPTVPYYSQTIFNFSAR